MGKQLDTKETQIDGKKLDNWKMSTKLSSKLIVHVSIPEKLSRDFSLPGDLSHLRQK